MLHLLLYGHTVKEVADQLFISPFTVKAHVRNISAKLGCHSIGGIVATVYRMAFDLTIEDVIKKVGTFCLLGIFSVYTFCGGGDDMVRRIGRRSRRNEIEVID